MAKKASKKLTRATFKKKMRKQLDQYGYFNGEFLPDKNGDAPKLATIITRVLNETSKGNTAPALAVILRKQVQKASAGDTKSAEFLFDRVYGKPQQTIQVSQPPPINIEHSVISVEDAKKTLNAGD